MFPRKRLPALAYVDYRRYLFGSFVSNVGNMLQATAISLHVWDLTKSSVMVGALGLVRVGPLLLFSLIGGIIADHNDRRKVMFICNIILALLALALVALELFHLTTVWLIYIAVALIATVRAFEAPSRQSLVVNLVPVESIPNAIGLNGISWRLSDVIGPLIAGLTIVAGGFGGAGGFGTCYLLNFASFFAVMASLWLLPPKPPAAGNGGSIKTVGEIFTAIGEGLQFMRRTPVVRSAMLIDFWATFFSAADALIPAFAHSILDVGDAGAGMMQAAIGIGALVGAVFMTWIPTPVHQGRWVIAMVALYGVCTVLFGFSPNLTLALIFLAGTGFADMVSTVLRQTIRQLNTPDNMRGRMSATGTLFQATGPQLGDFEAGAVAAGTGERLSVAIGGVACVGIAALWSRGRHLKDYEHQTASPSA